MRSMFRSAIGNSESAAEAMDAAKATLARKMALGSSRTGLLTRPAERRVRRPVLRIVRCVFILEPVLLNTLTPALSQREREPATRHPSRRLRCPPFPQSLG